MFKRQQFVVHVHKMNQDNKITYHSIVSGSHVRV